MWHAPNAQRWELGDLLEVNHDTTMASGHCVLAISRHGHKLGMSNRRRIAQCIQEAGYKVENVLDNVSFEHWDGDPM